jgi:glucose-6-phosphate 1-dehydrogenase
MLALLGALSAFGPLSMDMYLPSTPTIAANLRATQTLVQLTLSGCLAGLAVGQLVAGPLSDGLGRKRPLLAGVAAFAVLSVACAAAPDIGLLIALRFLQGMAGAVGVVLSLAMVRDLYHGSELARVLGSLMLVFGLAPVLAPVIGGQVVEDAYHESPQLFSLFFTIKAIGLTSMSQLGALPFLLGALLSPLAGLGGEGAATVAGIMIGTLCVGGLACQLIITRKRQPAEVHLSLDEPRRSGRTRAGRMVIMSADQVDALVIFGATGDLAKLETFPALVGLVERGVLDVPVVGVAKSGWGLPQFRDYAAASLKLNNMDPTAPAAVKMLDLLKYVDGDLDDHTTYEAMAAELGPGAKKMLYYLEVPPFLFSRIAVGISEVGLAAGSRVMVEKPFGNDLASAQALNETMHEYFPEDSVYRVDHWLGLDPVESLMFARFANSIIEPMLNRNYVRSIQITMAEAFDVADRGAFYDKTGAIKDVIQNHMLQVLATVLAEPPDGSGLESWRSSKAQLISAIRPLSAADVIKGQYDGYLSVDGVGAGSKTETFAAVRLAADTWRWDGVPIVIRAGKALAVTATDVFIDFKRPPRDVFGLGDVLTSNALRFRVWPESQAVLTLVGKKPGGGWTPEVQELSFNQHPGADMRPYDRLIGAALSGERWLFAQQGTVEASWRVVDPVLGDVGPLTAYERGSWGPDVSPLLPADEAWYDPTA